MPEFPAPSEGIVLTHFIVSGDHRFDGADALPALVEALSN